MDKELAQRLKNYLQENFPHLLSIWGKEKWDEFISNRATKAFDLYCSLNDRGRLSAESGARINAVLFEGIIFSPFKLMKSAIEHEFPRFQEKLATLEPEGRLRILIDVTLYCNPSGIIGDNLNKSCWPELIESDLITKIARYLHSQLMISAATPAVS